MSASRARCQPQRKHVPVPSAEELAWQQHALCKEVDPEIFFPAPGGAIYAAKRVCQACDVRAECLRYALKHNETHGVWGGAGEKERRDLLRRLRGKSA